MKEKIRANDPKIEVVGEIRFICPEEAEEMLTTLYERQRNLSAIHVQSMAADMKAGRFSLSQDAIAFDTDERLINGQHRLRAVVESGTEQPFVVLRGFPTDAYALIDQGRVKNRAAVLKFLGYGDSSFLAMTTSFLMSVIRSYKDDCALGPSARRILSTIEVREWIEANPDIADSIEATKGQKVMSKTAAAALHWLVAQSPFCEPFFEKAASGEGLEKGDPILMLRESIISRRNSRVTMYAPIQFLLASKAWNAFVSKKKIHTLKIMPNEKFPALQHVRKIKGIN